MPLKVLTDRKRAEPRLSWQFLHLHTKHIVSPDSKNITHFCTEYTLKTHLHLLTVDLETSSPCQIKDKTDTAADNTTSKTKI